MKIWKPRSRKKPSTMSVRTRPPTALDDSRRRKGMFWELRWVAAAKPARPAPIIMTLVLGREEGVEVGVSWEEHFGLNLNGFGEEGKKMEGLVEGRESVMIVIGELDKVLSYFGLGKWSKPLIGDHITYYVWCMCILIGTRLQLLP